MSADVKGGYPAGDKPLSEFRPLRKPGSETTLREELAMQAASWADHHDPEKCHEHRCCYCEQVSCGQTIRAILDAHRTATQTLGSLTAEDLGRTVRFRYVGATYEGTLTKVQHSRDYIGDDRATFVVIEGPENWSHVNTYRSSTPCEVAPR